MLQSEWDYSKSSLKQDLLLVELLWADCVVVKEKKGARAESLNWIHSRQKKTNSANVTSNAGGRGRRRSSSIVENMEDFMVSLSLSPPVQSLCLSCVPFLFLCYISAKCCPAVWVGSRWMESDGGQRLTEELSLSLWLHRVAGNNITQQTNEILQNKLFSSFFFRGRI